MAPVHDTNWSVPRLDQIVFWLVVLDGWATGATALVCRAAKGVLREWWEFRVWFAREEAKFGAELGLPDRSPLKDLSTPKPD